MGQMRNGPPAQNPTARLAVQSNRLQPAPRIFGSAMPWRDILTPRAAMRPDASLQSLSAMKSGASVVDCKQLLQVLLRTLHPLPRILEAEGLGFVVVSKGFRKTSPGHDCAQRLLRRVSRHVVFELIEKPAPWCGVIGAFLQYTPDVGGKRNVSQQLVLEESLSVVQSSAREFLADIGQPNIAFLDFRQSQQLQCLGNWKQVVHFHVK